MEYIGAILPLIFSFLLVLSIAQATDVHYCDKNADYAVKVKGVEILPYPIERGGPAIFSIAATAGGVISNGKLVIDVSYFSWRIYSGTYDLCSETSCPVKAGDFRVSHSQVLPIFTPPGSYSLKMRMLDSNNKELTCIRFSFEIGFMSSLADM